MTAPTYKPPPVRRCSAPLPHGRHIWADPQTWAGGANVATWECTGRLDWPTSELDTLRAKLAAVEALIAQAKRISPGPGMSLYVADLERALGREVNRPHKLGQRDEAKP